MQTLIILPCFISEIESSRQHTKESITAIIVSLITNNGCGASLTQYKFLWVFLPRYFNEMPINLLCCAEDSIHVKTSWQDLVPPPPSVQCLSDCLIRNC